MSLTRRLGTPRGSGLSPTVVIDEAAVNADVPVAGSAGELSCRLHMSYSVADPLVIRLIVQAPSGATVTEALLLRSDFGAALNTQAVVVGSVATAVEGRQVQLIFSEGTARFGVSLPRDLVEDFLAATKTLVGMDDKSEAEACTAAAWSLLNNNDQTKSVVRYAS